MAANPNPPGEYKDGCAADANQTESRREGQEISVKSAEQRSAKLTSHALVHDVVVKVEISSQCETAKTFQSRSDYPSPDLDGLKKAEIAISPWSMEHQRYFTLTFTSFADPSLSTTPTQLRGTFQAEHQGASSETSASVLPSPISSSDGQSHDSPTATTYSSTKNATSIALAADLGGFNKSRINNPSNLLERLNRIKAAMIDSVETPVIAMCQDESFAVANKAALTLMHQETDSATTAPLDLFAELKLYTEDFGRKLEPEEYPIVQICRSRKSFDKRKVGVLDSKSQRKRFDVRGETIFDKRNGEFVGGIVFMKDVTGFAEIIPNQFATGPQQFKLICDTIPQMVWLMEIDGIEACS